MNIRVLTAQALAGHSQDAATRVARRGAHLLMTKSRNDQSLTEHLHVLQSAAHGTVDVIDARSRAGDPPTWLHLALLIPQAVFGAFGERPLVLATLFDPTQVNSLDPFALAAVFKLTPAQGKVATQLADGLTAQQIAALNGTSAATVRSHVRGVLRRLGAQRTADVVRMLRQGEALWAGGGGQNLPK